VQVRKTTAEKLYVRILTMEDKFPGASVDGVLAVLTDTAWSGPIAVCLRQRDLLYGMFGMEVPSVRSGLGATDQHVMAESTAHTDDAPGAPGATTRGDGGDDFDSYGALVKEAGY
jgi:hypothetical protein